MFGPAQARKAHFNHVTTPFYYPEGGADLLHALLSNFNASGWEEKKGVPPLTGGPSNWDNFLVVPVGSASSQNALEPMGSTRLYARVHGPRDLAVF